MGQQGDSGLGGVRDGAEFIAAMRRLKERSGLTYRQLEERAAENGEVLARSTVADVLRGRTVPRPALLTAFVRACGEQEHLGEWLRVRERAVGRPVAGTPARRGRLASVPRGLALSLTLIVVAPLAGTIWWLFPRDDSEDPPERGVGPVLPAGRVLIRPVGADGLCLTEGRVRGYEPLVAVQRPCEAVAPQETSLKSLGGDTYRIQWYHPDQGLGCLKALTAGAVRGLLEPWSACEQSSRFHIRPTGPDGSRRYTIRADGHGCVGIKNSATSAGAEAVMRPCDNARGQTFRIESAP